MPHNDEMFNTNPPLGCSCMTRLASWVTNRGARRFRAMTEVEKRGDAVAELIGGAPPALLITTSRWPKCSTTASMMAVTSSNWRRSPPTKNGSRPPADGSTSGSFRAQMATSAPASRNASVKVAPRPRLPPVTRTTWLDRSGRSVMADNLSSGPRLAGCRSGLAVFDPRHQLQDQTPASGLDQDEAFLEVGRFAVIGVRYIHRPTRSSIV